jgi:hypothetical protein
MTGAELKALSTLLLEMAEEFKDHTQNDWTVPASRESKTMLEAAIEYNRRLGLEGLDLDEALSVRAKKYYIWDDWLMRYLEHRCNPGQPALRKAELAALGDLLAMIARDDFKLLVEKERIAEVRYLAARCKGKKAVARAFAGPASTPAESVASAKRPGVNERWAKAWKSMLANNTEWFKTHWRGYRQEASAYVRTGKVVANWATRSRARGWDVACLDIGSLLYLWKFERAAVEDGRWDGEAASSGFTAAYLANMLELNRGARWRSNPQDLPSLDIQMPFCALGFVLGLRERAEPLARANIAAVRKGWFNEDWERPISAFILRLLADYFSQEPLVVRGDPKRLPKGQIAADPWMKKLFEVWRDPDPAVVARRLIAACDIHTDQCIGGMAGMTREFGNLWWTRTPIAALLVLKLRETLGLPNPRIDHPLMATLLGRLPEAPPVQPEEMLRAVEARMRKEGFDERKILAEYGVAYRSTRSAFATM